MATHCGSRKFADSGWKSRWPIAITPLENGATTVPTISGRGLCSGLGMMPTPRSRSIVVAVVTLNRLSGRSMAYGGSPSQIARITSIASANILLRSSSRMPSTSASELSAPGLMPRMNRPSERWSNIAELAATSTGCCWERFVVPVARRICSVSEIRLARKSRLLVMFSCWSVRCSPRLGPRPPERVQRHGEVTQSHSALSFSSGRACLPTRACSALFGAARGPGSGADRDIRAPQ